MRRLVVTMFMTLDGVVEAPEKWSFPYWNDEIERFKHDELFASDAQLLGRVTYQGFAAAWPTRKGEYADRLNSLPKYVVSTTLEKTEWRNSHLIKANVQKELSNLKQQPGEDILVHGSRTLVQTLMQLNLTDEYRFLVSPIVLGSGMHLFGDGSKTTLQLVEAKGFSSGAVLLRYRPDKVAS